MFILLPSGSVRGVLMNKGLPYHAAALYLYSAVVLVVLILVVVLVLVAVLVVVLVVVLVIHVLFLRKSLFYGIAVMLSYPVC